MDSDVDFVIWEFPWGSPKSIEFGYAPVSIGHWLLYCYNQTLNGRNKYASLSRLTNRTDMIGYVHNSNCSLNELAKMIKILGPNEGLGCYRANIKLKRRTKRIPEYEMITDVWTLSCCTSYPSKIVWREDVPLWLDLLNFA